MHFTEASGRKVVSTSTAETVGKVDDYVVDPSGPSVAALKVKKSEGETLRWADIVAFGTDAVTVESAEKITKDADDDLAPLLEKRNQMHKKRVLTTTGDEIGSVKDIDFDPASGKITSLILDRGEIAAGRLVGVGSYAVVVEAETSAGSGGPAQAASSQAPAQAPSAQSAPSAPKPPPTGVPTSVDPPNIGQAQRASYPPAE